MLNTRILETIDLNTLSAILQDDNFREGIEAGHTYFDDTFEQGEPLTVDEMTELVVDSSFTSEALEHSAKACFVLDAIQESKAQGKEIARDADMRAFARKLDWSAFEREKEAKKAESFIYCLGFVVGVIDSGLQPAEQD